MMQQFLTVKREYPGVVVFYRMGDFYETFFEDALITSKALEITLTARDAGALGKVPMAGVPAKAVEAYLQRLLAKNFKIAICEQVQDPAEAKGLVERRVTRLLSKGTVTENGYLNPKQNNYLAAIACVDEKNWSIAYCDASTGLFEAGELNYTDILNVLDRLQPSELLVPGKKIKGAITTEWVPAVPDEIKDTYSCTPYLCDIKKATSAGANICKWFNLPELSAFGLSDKPVALLSIDAILDYIERTYIEEARPAFEAIKLINHCDYLEMTASTRQHLELTRTARNNELAKNNEGSLLELLDNTITPMGGRLIRNWVLQPSGQLSEIHARLETVEDLVFGQEKERLIEKVRTALESVYDLERLASKLVNQTIMPRELLAIQQASFALPVISELLGNYSSYYLSQLAQIPGEIIDIGQQIESSLLQNAPVSIKEGGIFASGYNPEVDRLRHTLETQDSWQQNYEQSEKEKTGLRNLKVAFNNAFGYYIEISKAQAKDAPESYHRKQTLTNCERFITPELKAHENAVFEAQNNLASLEYQLYSDFRASLVDKAGLLKEYAKRLAVLDVLTGFALVSQQQHYVCPKIDDSEVLDIRNGRHPVLEYKLPLGQFVPNDCTLSSESTDLSTPQLLIITGPNMAGKSTYMRQVALCIIMGQLGCFVPASYCHFGLVDKLYARIGASDDLGRGQSTFMVEMIETAEILNCATSRSFVVFDEVGRGTSTYDGISIAWSVVDYIVKNVGARVLFATHYHELNTLESMHPKIKNVRVTVSETEGDIHFLYRVAEGAAQKSYGIQVAKMSGMPASVVQQAEKLLNKLQEKDMTISDQKREKLLKRFAEQEGQLQFTL